MYDANGKPLMQPRNVMTEFDKVAARSNVDNYPTHLSQNQHFPYSMTSQNNQEVKLLPATERAIHESQLAMQREVEKQRKLEQFQKRTKMAASIYNQNVKSESQIKIEQQKQEAEQKVKKVKDFGEKLKQIRKTMKVKFFKHHIKVTLYKFI